MKTIKIIDLLNMISKGEEVPKKIKYLYYEYEFNEEEKEYQRLQNEIIYGLGEDRRLDIVLDDEVKIIEEPQEHKIPEKICTNRIINTKDILEFEMIQNKINAEYTYVINEILDYLEEIELKKVLNNE